LVFYEADVPRAWALGPLPLLWDKPWPAPVVPFSVNVIQHPLPTARRL
jgi:hypothetical protein